MPNQDLFNGQLLVGLAALVSLAVGVVNIVMSGRRNPPIDAQFATKEELASIKGELAGQTMALRSELNADIRRIFERMDALTIELNKAGEHRTDQIRDYIQTLAVKLARVEVQSEK